MHVSAQSSPPMSGCSNSQDMRAAGFHSQLFSERRGCDLWVAQSDATSGLFARPVLEQYCGVVLGRVQVKGAIQAYVKARDATAFAQALAEPLRGSGRAADVGKALESYVARGDRLCFRRVLQV